MPEPTDDPDDGPLERSGAWPARVLWVLLALVSASSLSDALDGRSVAIRATGYAIAALAWTVGLIALLVPRTTSLTVARIVVPAGLAGAAAAAVAGDHTDLADVATLAIAALAVIAVLAPWFTDAWVDGSSYGNERRVALRTPVAFAAVIVPATFAAVVVGAVVGPFLLAAQAWVPGAIALVIGWPAAYAGARALHQLSRRWIVLVPTGMVLHDPLTMPEPQLFPRADIATLGPAPAPPLDGAADLTAGAAGLAVQLVMREPGELLVRNRGRGTSTTSATAVLFTPLRPAHLLAAASAHRLAVQVDG